jgi:hypothetical protein
MFKMHFPSMKLNGPNTRVAAARIDFSTWSTNSLHGDLLYVVALATEFPV